MCHDFLNDSSFFQLLQRIDDDWAATIQAGACPQCGATLHRARYPRKPRGIASHLLGDKFWIRWSFCCARDGCRQRQTPESVRFLGRRVYLGIVVVLSGTWTGGRSAWHRRQLPVPDATLRRWRRWWQRDFVATRCWQHARGQLATPINTSALPGALMAHFGTNTSEAVVALLKFIAPVTTRPGNGLGEGRPSSAEDQAVR